MRRGQRAGLNAFFIKKTRFAKMNMNIYQTGKYHEILTIDLYTAGRFGQRIGNRNNIPMINEKIDAAKGSVFQNLRIGKDITHNSSSKNLHP